MVPSWKCPFCSGEVIQTSSNFEMVAGTSYAPQDWIACPKCKLRFLIVIRPFLQGDFRDTVTGKMDIDAIMTGKPATVRDSLGQVMAITADLEKETGTVEESTLIQAIAEKVTIPDHEGKITEAQARRLIGTLIKEGMIYSPKEGKLKRTSS